MKEVFNIVVEIDSSFNKNVDPIYNKFESKAISEDGQTVYRLRTVWGPKDDPETGIRRALGFDRI